MTEIQTEEKIEIASELLEQLEHQFEKQVIVHGIIHSQTEGQNIRLWPTIYLLPKETSGKCKLIQSFNILLYPQWQVVGRGKTHRFTLIFEGLPFVCKSFDLVEIIPEPGGFEAQNINRNKEDVYTVVF